MSQISNKEVQVIAGENKISPNKVRAIYATDVFKLFDQDVKAQYLQFFCENDRDYSEANRLLRKYYLDSLNANQTFMLRNTILTGNPATASQKLRPDFFKGIPARRWTKERLQNQIIELLEIYAENEADCPITVIANFYLYTYQHYRRRCIVNCYGRAEGPESKIDELEVYAEEHGRKAIRHFEKSTDWQWMKMEDGEWIGPNFIDKIENFERVDGREEEEIEELKEMKSILEAHQHYKIKWDEWLIIGICVGGYVYYESDKKKFTRLS
ncbi:MAG: hypothetical protein JRI72_06735 [Deltaproteobacteria bacterium]|nr:hypothetical protein [Deltaproteobacteria bacterium]